MEPLHIGLLAIGAMLALIALSIPVAFSIFIVAIVGLWYLGGLPFDARHRRRAAISIREPVWLRSHSHVHSNGGLLPKFPA